jgi:cytochrome c-type biogenesis protein CcmH
VTTFLVLAALMASAAVALVSWPLLRAPEGEARTARVPAILLAIFLPVAAGALYHLWSTYSWNPADLTTGPVSIEQMVSRLERRLERSPNDLEGWLMLGRSDVALNRYENAVAAYEHAYKLSEGKNAQAAAGLGEAMALVDARAIDGRAADLFEEALRDDPQNPQALWYGGIVALHRRDANLARDRWMTLLKLGPPKDVASILAMRIAELDQQLGRPADPTLAQLANGAPEPAMPAAATPAAGTSAAGTPAPASAAAAGGNAVHVHVSIAPALQASVRPTDTLFVLARDPQAPGPPLAVKRFPPGQGLPVDVELTAADAMIPARSIATVRQATVVARLSRAGQPLPASGDLYGELSYDVTTGRASDLIIDRTVP